MLTLRLLSGCALAALLTAVPGCTRAPVQLLQSDRLACEIQTQSRLYFGLQTPSGAVTEAQWQAFVDDVVTPRLSHGFTLFDARGQWRDGTNGMIVREGSRLIEVVGHDTARDRQALAEIVATYRARFEQQAVLVTQVPIRACL